MTIDIIPVSTARQWHYSGLHSQQDIKRIALTSINVVESLPLIRPRASYIELIAFAIHSNLRVYSSLYSVRQGTKNPHNRKASRNRKKPRQNINNKSLCTAPLFVLAFIDSCGRFYIIYIYIYITVAIA